MGVQVQVPVFKTSVEGDPNKFAMDKMNAQNAHQNRANHALAKGGSRKRTIKRSRKRSKKRSKYGSRKRRRMLKGGKGVEIAPVPTRGLPANTQQQNAGTMTTLLQQNANSVYDKNAF